MAVENPVESHFDRVVSSRPVQEYEFDLAQMGWRDRRIVQTIRRFGVGGKRALDLGPGPGRWLQFLAREGASCLCAIDISQECLNRAAPVCSRVQKGDLEVDRFDFESGSFDLVLSLEVLEHLRRPEQYLAEIRRVIRLDGMVLMSTPNIASWASRVRLVLGQMPFAIVSDPTHVKFYRQREIGVLLSRLGFEVSFIPTSFSLSPLREKSKFRVPSNRWLCGLDDSLLFSARVSEAYAESKEAGDP